MADRKRERPAAVFFKQLNSVTDDFIEPQSRKTKKTAKGAKLLLQTVPLNLAQGSSISLASKLTILKEISNMYGRI